MLSLPLQSLSRFPTLNAHRSDGRSLKGAIVYHDGQFNDSRLAVILACTAAAAGAAVLNHAEVVKLLKVRLPVLLALPCFAHRAGRGGWWVPPSRTASPTSARPASPPALSYP